MGVTVNGAPGWLISRKSRWAFPALRIVAIWVGAASLTSTEPKRKRCGVTCSCGPTPRPCITMVTGPASMLTSAVAVKTPAVSGAKVNSMRQLLCGGTDRLHSSVRRNGAPTAPPVNGDRKLVSLRL